MSSVRPLIKEISRYFMLAHLLLKGKYADSRLGILWVPLTNLFLIAILVAIFGSKNKEIVWHFAGYISVGYICWAFIADSISNYCDVFRTRRSELQAPGVKTYSIFLRALVERVYILVFNLIALSFLFIPVLLDNYERLIYLPLALLLIMLQSYFLTLLLSMCVLFLPDIKRLLANLVRILFFSSPIFWGFGGEISGARGYFYHYNPVTYFIELVRYSLGVSVNLPINEILLTTVAITAATSFLALVMVKALPKYSLNIQ